MDIAVNFEPKEKYDNSAEERILKELEAKSKYSALAKNGKLPSLSEILYGSEEDMKSLKDVLNDATDE